MFYWGYLDAVDEEYNIRCRHIAAWARILLFFVIMICFGALLGSAILLALKWATKYILFGILQLISTILLFVGGIIWRAGRNLTATY